MTNIQKNVGIQPEVKKEINLRDKAMAGDMAFVVSPATTTRVPTTEAWERTVEVELQTAAGERHTWFNKAIATGVSVGDTSSAGTATIPSTTLTFIDGKAEVAVSGDAAAWLGGTAQVETVAVTAGSDKNATLVVRVTAAGMAGSPVDVNVAVTTDDDTAAEVAAKVRTALSANANVADFFTVSGSSANVILTAKTPAANDGTLAITLQSADTSSVTFGASGNTTAGVAKETNTLTVAQATILGYTVASKTSVETISA